MSCESSNRKSLGLRSTIVPEVSAVEKQVPYPTPLLCIAGMPLAAVSQYQCESEWAPRWLSHRKPSARPLPVMVVTPDPDLPWSSPHTPTRKVHMHLKLESKAEPRASTPSPSHHHQTAFPPRPLGDPETISSPWKQRP